MLENHLLKINTIFVLYIIFIEFKVMEKNLLYLTKLLLNSLKTKIFVTFFLIDLKFFILFLIYFINKIIQYKNIKFSF